MADAKLNKVQKGRRKYDPVRSAALEAIVLVEQGETTDDAIKSVSRNKAFRSIDRRFLTQLVNGATKMRRRLDHEIRFYLAKPSAKLPIKLQNILRLGFYQLIFTDRVPAAAAVSESVNLAHHHLDRSQVGLVNAVLRTRIREPEKVIFSKPQDNPAKYLGTFYSYPDHFVKFCLDDFGFERTEKLLESCNRPPHVTYRVNYLKAKPEEIADQLTQAGIGFTPGEYLPEFLHIQGGGIPLEDELLRTGKVFIQDESSGLPVRLLNPKPGSTVIDLTAAPGGKATYMAIRMRNKGRVTAVDKSHARLELLIENCKRLGIRIVAPVVSNMLDFKSGQFDRVLLDPPCSGWGTVRKHADLRWAKYPQDVLDLIKVQTIMIDRAAKLVKPGGVMVYSTCTILRKENDQIVEEFLLRNPEFSVESGTQFFDKTLVNDRGFVKTYPGFEDLDGSFCARLKRQVHG